MQYRERAVVPSHTHAPNPVHLRTHSSPSGLLSSSSTSNLAAATSAPSVKVEGGTFADLSREKLHFAHQELLVAKKPHLREEIAHGGASQIVKSGSFRRRKVQKIEYAKVNISSLSLPAYKYVR